MFRYNSLPTMVPDPVTTNGPSDGETRAPATEYVLPPRLVTASSIANCCAETAPVCRSVKVLIRHTLPTYVCDQPLAGANKASTTKSEPNIPEVLAIGKAMIVFS